MENEKFDYKQFLRSTGVGKKQKIKKKRRFKMKKIKEKDPFKGFSKQHVKEYLENKPQDFDQTSRE